MKKIVLVAIIGILLASAASCGYGFRHQQSNLPPDIRTISIPMFKNRTNELRLEAVVTEQVRYQFSQSQILKIVSEGEADVILEGIVTSVSSDDVSLTETVRSQQRRVRVGMSVTLTRTDNGELLYRGSVSQQRSYAIGGDNSATLEARADALRLVARTAAQTIHDGVLQNF